jgi:hypothetical protein
MERSDSGEVPHSACPDLFRASTTLLTVLTADVDGCDRLAHDAEPFEIERNDSGKPSPQSVASSNTPQQTLHNAL